MIWQLNYRRQNRDFANGPNEVGRGSYMYTDTDILVFRMYKVHGYLDDANRWRFTKNNFFVHTTYVILYTSKGCTKNS